MQSKPRLVVILVVVILGRGSFNLPDYFLPYLTLPTLIIGTSPDPLLHPRGSAILPPAAHLDLNHAELGRFDLLDLSSSTYQCLAGFLSSRQHLQEKLVTEITPLLNSCKQLTCLSRIKLLQVKVTGDMHQWRFFADIATQPYPSAFCKALLQVLSND